jgi:hypothetical protein
MLYYIRKVILLLLNIVIYHFVGCAENGLHWQQRKAMQGFLSVGGATFFCATLYKNITESNESFSRVSVQTVEVVNLFVRYICLPLCFKDLITNKSLGFCVIVLSFCDILNGVIEIAYVTTSFRQTE